jgi:signal transduction histidine kinase
MSFFSGSVLRAVACLILFSAAPDASAEVVEKVVKLPVSVSAGGETVSREITLTIVRDDTRKKSPFMILNHGRAPTAEGRAKFGRAVFRDQTRYFVQQGYAVFLPTRIGYGVTGGPDVESSGACNAKDYAAALAPAVAQVAAAVTYAQAQDYVAAILSSVDRLGEQIENVLDLPQSETGTLPLAAEPVELFPLLADVVRERAERLAEARITLDLRGSAAIGAVTGNKRRLRRLFGQLIDNAMAATPAGGRILVEASRRKAAKDSAGTMQVVVSDNGCGMDPTQLARALEGLRISADGRSVERRGGVGLPLVRQLVAAHGGTFELMSEKGQGTSAMEMLRQ